jgi:hypothetical protein
MFGAIDQSLMQWVRDLLGDTKVSLAPPPSDPGINLYLMSMEPLPPARTNERSPLQVRLNYLVSSWNKDAQQAHDQLSQLVFAAMDHADFEVSFALTPDLWSSFGTPSRPAFILSVIARHERPQPAVPRVRHPMVTESIGLTALSGLVTGPDEIPLAGAYVVLPTIQLSQYTNPHGEFIFQRVPMIPLRLLVRAKGAERQLTVEHPNEEPVRIHFDAF